MKTSTVLLLGGAGLAAYYFAQLGVAGATVQFVFNGFNFQSLTQLQINVLVQNVSNAAINFNAMSGTVSVTANGQTNPLGNVSYFPPSPTQIAPTSQLIVPFTANISLLNLPSTIMNLINQVPGSGSYTFVIAGNANINSLVVPFSLSYPVNL